MIPFLDKYWNREKEVNILGFSEPDIKLPPNYNFISMRPQQESIDDWANDIANVLENESVDYVIFTLDDFIPVDTLNIDVYDKVRTLIEEDSNIVRCSLGIDLFVNSPHTVIENCGDYDIIEQQQLSDYRITTQPSIWKREYLVSVLRKSTNPWLFETKNKANDGFRMIGTRNRYCYRWVEETALSGRHPGKINVLGMKPEDIKWCIGNGILRPEELQYGQHVGRVPQFIDYGYDFKIEVLRSFVDNITYDLYVKKYKSVYE